MNNAILFRMGGLSAALSGLTIIIGKILAMISLYRSGEFFDYLSPLLGLLAVVAIYLRFKDRSGIHGLVSFAILFLGISMVMCLDYFGAFILPYLPVGLVDQLLDGPVGTTLAISGLVFLIGVILFGISVIRTGEFPLISSLLFIAGFIPVPFGEILPDVVVYTGSISAGLGLILWGIHLYQNSVTGKLLANKV